MRARTVVSLLLLAACGAPGAQPVVPVTPVEPTPAGSGAADTPPPAASLAAVTSQMLADAYQNVSVLGEWDEVLTNFTNRVGAPTSVGKSPIGTSADTRVWALVEGDTCYLLTLQTNAQGNNESNYGSFKRGQFLFDRCEAATVKP